MEMMLEVVIGVLVMEVGKVADEVTNMEVDKVTNMRGYHRLLCQQTEQGNLLVQSQRCLERREIFSLGSRSRAGFTTG